MAAIAALSTRTVRTTRASPSAITPTSTSCTRKPNLRPFLVGRLIEPTDESRLSRKDAFLNNPWTCPASIFRHQLLG